LSARTARLQQAKEETLHSVDHSNKSIKSAPSRTEPSSSVGISSSAKTSGSTYVPPVLKRVRSNSEGSNVWRSEEMEKKDVNKYGYSKSKFTVFGNLEE